jgi:hypothetical protein
MLHAVAVAVVVTRVVAVVVSTAEAITNINPSDIVQKLLLKSSFFLFIFFSLIISNESESCSKSSSGYFYLPSVPVVPNISLAIIPYHWINPVSRQP